ncbi:hypothetical protein CK203_050470 [Vitis vinifera]|uniref:Uncharacterized protein n=1 Tax=Vitis vinifera TaxID=29760 RepID=A0A438H207_VITVI|nr:hypothetical protein CK203_050470 [Vitis vinifera]
MSVDGGIFFSEIFPATKQSVNRKCYSLIFSIADKTELNMDIARRQARINQLVREMLVEARQNLTLTMQERLFVLATLEYVVVVLEPNPYNMLVVSLCRPVHIDLGISKKRIATCISFLLLMVVTCRSSSNLLFPLCIT